MVNYNRLRDVIKENGTTKSFLASKMGISLNSLQNKLTGVTQFSIENAYILSKTLHLDEPTTYAIFFADDVNSLVTGESNG